MLLPVSAAGQVRINEILFAPDPASTESNRNRQWVEIYNAGADPVSLSGFLIANRTGREGGRPLPSEDLAGGGYR
jgi:hypothetical protein